MTVQIAATMKKLTLFLAALGLINVADAGPEPLPTKEDLPVPTSSPSWYRDNEWDISAWFARGFTGTGADRNSLADTFSADRSPGMYDRFLADDHAFGGGAGVKYFFRRYFGLGIEGFALAADSTSYTVENFGATAFKAHDDHTVGSALATLTLRYPIGQTRLAPYVWAGGGGAFGGHNETAVYLGGLLERVRHDVETRPMGEFGGGFEIRITPHVGLLSDFSWNVVDGTHNNFGLIRTGINFAF
jgi:hypothetical protein